VAGQRLGGGLLQKKPDSKTTRGSRHGDTILQERLAAAHTCLVVHRLRSKPRLDCSYGHVCRQARNGTVAVLASCITSDLCNASFSPAAMPALTRAPPAVVTVEPAASASQTQRQT
jgi:hypothetical protein